MSRNRSLRANRITPFTDVNSNHDEDTGISMRVVPGEPIHRKRPEPVKSQGVDMRYLVRALIKYGASDLHLKPQRPPMYRINGKLIPAKMDILDVEDVESLIFSVLTDFQIRDLQQGRQVDLSFGMKNLGRFRCNAYYQRGTLAAAIRMIPMTVPDLANLGLPEVVGEICYRPRGLILVTGATGSGKSTSLAAMVQHINNNRHVHVLTVEDPIEYVFSDQRATISQREIGTDTSNVEEALISGLRQDIDVLMIGELRTTEMIQAALTAAETGHLVLATLHTVDAKSSIERILDVFSHEAQNQIRIQLATTLIGVVSQDLIPRSDGSGRALACEVMIKSPTIEDYIRKNQVEKIDEAIANSRGYYKMQSKNQALKNLIETGVITAEEGLKASVSPDDLKLLISGFSRGDGYEVRQQDDQGGVLLPRRRPQKK